MLRFLICSLLSLTAFSLVIAQTFGDNLVLNAGFEMADDTGQPKDWQITAAEPVVGAVDSKIVLVGKQSLKLTLPDTSRASLRSRPITVTAGVTYLFSVGFRSEGFGEPGKYLGVDAFMSLEWFDDGGKQIGRHVGPTFPYHPLPWDLRDNFITAPAGATLAIIVASVSNHSAETGGANIPSALWLDGIQLRPYTPPPTPAWAAKPPERVVDGGWSHSRVTMPNLGDLNYAGGKWSTILPDKGSLFGTVLRSPEGVGSGLMAHSPYYMNAKPGLYRGIIRCKVVDTARKEAAGRIDIDSQFASSRANMPITPTLFAAADTYQEFSFDYVLRTPGYWDFRIFTEGNQPFTVEWVKTFPLQLFTDQQLLDIYPGSDGVISANLQVVKPYEFSTLLVASLHYDFWRLPDALHLSHYRARITPVWVEKGNAQAFPDFPDTPEALFNRHLVILCDVDAGSFSLRQKRMLAEFVRRGGGLLVLGGHKTFERGGFRGSLLDELLPVTFPEGDLPPLVHLPAGGTLRTAAPHPLTEYLDLSAAPKCFYRHTLQPREGARTVLTVDDAPAVVLGTYGKGRVACVGLTAMGLPGPNQTPFWQWDQWTAFLRDLCWWTGGEDQHFE